MKQLIKEMIPEGFNWAAVDQNGTAWAYFRKPKIEEFSFWPGHNVYKLIGEGFDNINWQNSLIQRISEEVAELKKLKVEDIPQDCKWAAIDQDGMAFAYEAKPKVSEVSFVAQQHSYFILIGTHYDSADWKNSLISR